MDIAFPYDVAADGTTAISSEDRHLRELIEQILFTAPGERVMRPDFGSGLLQLVFEPNSDALAAALRVGVEAALQQHLADRIELEGVEIENQESTLRITVVYRARHDGRRRVELFEREV